MSTPNHDTCWTMLRAAATGDRGALSDFVGSYSRPIRSYLAKRWRGMSIEQATDDAAQDVFLECLKSGGVLQRAATSGKAFRALLYAVVRNVARRYEEGAARQRVKSGAATDLDELPADDEAQSRLFDREWARAIVRDAVLRHARAARRGDEGQRLRYRILRLRHHGGLPIRRIAHELGAQHVEAVHNDYRRARREFRAFLREAVRRHSGVADRDLDEECRRVTELLGAP